MHHWTTLEVLNTYGEPVRDAGETRRALAKMKWSGSCSDYFLGRVGEPHEDPDDASTWGPMDEDIDWTGFDGAQG